MVELTLRRPDAALRHGDAPPAREFAALAHDLEAALGRRADFSPGGRALFATDASNYRQTPIGVATPRTADDVVRIVDVCRRHGAPITSRGGGTALAGQTCNAAVVIDFSRWLTRIISIDAAARRATVEPGCILDHLRNAAEKDGLTFGPDPATHDHNTIGGMIGNNSCGVHSVQTGRTADNVEGLEILTYDGLRLDVGPTSDDDLRAIISDGGRRAQIYEDMRALIAEYGDRIRKGFPKLPRRVSGFSSLDSLLPENGFNVARALVGTEGTCAIILGATLKLVPSPRERVVVLVRFDDIFQAADAVADILAFKPLALEGVDRTLIDHIKKKGMPLRGLDMFREGGGWLIAEFGGESAADAKDAARKLIDSVDKSRTQLVSGAARQSDVWAVREAGLGATAIVPGEPDTFPGWEDSAVPPERFGDYLRDLKRLMAQYGYDAALYGHFGDGCLHCRMNFELGTRAGVAAWREFLDRAADLVVGHGGSLSGEHGDGQARAELLEKMYGAELVECFRRFKALWDPECKLNPGKVISPYPITSNLRTGPATKRADPETGFAYPRDGRSFGRAANRCVGVGKCRRREPQSGVMCPSYIATGEERHSTRGRARLLFEMLNGETITDGWRSDAVEEALSLCLACKGCYSDCPVGVDMATYKAEFRHHHYKNKLRPRAAYTLGMIHRWAPLMSLAPWLANAVLHAPLAGAGARWIAGAAREADLPRLAAITLRDRADELARGDGAERILLWPDTFNNHFQPDVGVAAARVLAALGCAVALAPKRLCCGRALYDWGFIDTARRLWLRTFEALDAEIARRTPLIILEPACYSAFKLELPELFPDDERARRLSDMATSFVDFAKEREWPAGLDARGRKALLQPHCHTHALHGVEAEEQLLEKLGVDASRFNEGCCGMAGAFGLARETHEVGAAVAERGFLQKARAAPGSTVILANGFSCREQLRHGAGRRAFHAAELAAQLMDNSTVTP